MDEIITERSGSILRIQLNRPAKKNAMTSDMYVTLAERLQCGGARTSRLASCSGMAQEIRSVLATMWRISSKNPPGSGEISASVA